MKVQIYLVSYDDVQICIDAGTDFIGVVADNENITPSSVTYSEVKRIFNTIPENITKVALTLLYDASEIITLVDEVNPDVLHFGYEPGKISNESLLAIKQKFPTLKLMQAIPMNSGDPINTALKYQKYFDFYILDTNDPNRVDLGATGLTHDWNISAEVTKKVKIPVILAGGLTPENVSEAIKKVKPWAVDSFSKTNVEKTNQKDKEKVERFVKNAKSTL